MSQTKHGKHSFIGQAESKWLLQWLNGEGARPHGAVAKRERVGRLIADMNRSAEIFLETGKADEKLVRCIDRELSRYKLWVETKHVSHNGDSKGALRLFRIRGGYLAGIQTREIR